jgi:hypothetical protein
MEDSRLASLIDLFAAGVLSAHEEGELYTQLASSSAAREQFDRQMVSHRIQNPEIDFPDAMEVVRAYENSRRDNRGDIHLPLQAIASAKLRAWCGAAAASVVVSTGLILFFAYESRALPKFQPPVAGLVPGLATLKQAAGVQWIGATNELFVGDAIGAGRLQIASGAMQLEFKRGASLIVEGPADLQIVSDNEAFLRSGKVTARVPQQAHGFKITSPSVAVVDLGTEFGLRALSNGPPEVHVFSGLVEMARPERNPKQLKEGEAARIKGARIRSITPERKAFLFENQLTARAAEEQAARYQIWKAAAKELSRDPAAVVHYTFEEQGDGAERVLNRGAALPKDPGGAITGCDWTEGRWAGKGAITFTGKQDRVRFTAPNSLTSMTYMVWLRVDRLLNSSNALALTETMQLGELHWQVYRDGRVAMSSRSGSGSSVDQSWDRGISPPIFTADRLGKWTHLVSVYDSSARTISHYVNGEFVSSTPIKRPVKLKLGKVELGNWGVRVEEPKWASMKSYSPAYLSRNLSGCLDEFALLSRALSPEEIKAYYEKGRVAAGALPRKHGS